jgi:hypothetical protein
MPLNALCISDTQEPFAHKDALEFVTFVDKIWFPGQNRIVVHMGDEVDQHTLGKWPANPDGRSGGDELKEARLRLSYWFDAFPKVYVCTSNHTYRAWKKAFHAGIPKEFMRSVGEVYGAPAGWLWSDRWVFDGVCFEHGEHVSGLNAAINAAKQNNMPTVIGHQHSNGGAQHTSSFNSALWGLNTGCLIDLSQYAFHYGIAFRNKPTLGMGVIKNGVPYFVPMVVDENNTWIKRI